MPAKRRRPGTGSVRQLPSGRWQARYKRPEDDAWVSAPKTFDTKLDASAFLDDGFDNGFEAPAEIAPDPLLREYAAVWLRDRDLKPRTRAHYRTLLDRLILPTLGGTRLSRLTPTAVRAWHASLDPSKATTRAHAYGLLRAVLATAVRDELLAANPCRVERATAVRRAHDVRPATLDELRVIVGAMPERYRTMVLLAAWCGLRFGELTELRRSDVDLDVEAGHGVLNVHRAVVRVGGEVIVGEPKSAAGVRTVAIPPHLVPVVADHLERHTGKAPTALLFPAADGSRHMAPSTLSKVFYPAREKAGRPDLRFHDLRHTGATLAAATGATLAELMARLGHSTAGAAMKYQHAVSDRDAAIAEALSGFAADNVVSLTGRRRKDSAASR